MKVLITGAEGMLGHDLVSVFSKDYEVIPADIGEFDITRRDQCERFFEENQPQVTLHAAAFTRVDDCESNVELAMAVNGDGAGNIAFACRRFHCRMVYFSSDYIFDGKRDTPYPEDAEPNPLSVYGRSKLEGEKQVRQHLPEDHLIIRTSWLFGIHGRNFIETIIKLAGAGKALKIVDDQRGCPTFTQDLAEGTKRLVDADARGIVNVTNRGITSWYGFACYFLDKAGINAEVTPARTGEYPLPAPRPAFSALDSTRYRSITGRNLPPWQDATERYLQLKHHNLFTESRS